jgi:hypothetical protein
VTDTSSAVRGKRIEAVPYSTMLDNTGTTTPNSHGFIASRMEGFSRLPLLTDRAFMRLSLLEYYKLQPAFGITGTLLEEVVA